jgi:glycosyltransferase involved in cell wall biosynthesis
MRILYIHQYFCTRNGRSGTRSYEFAKFLVQRGHRVTMITSTSDLSDVRIPAGQRLARLEVDGIHVLAIGIPYSHHMGLFARALSFAWFMLESTRIALMDRDHDVVVATSTPLTVGIPGMLASLFHGKPLVFEVRDLWPEAPIQLGALHNRMLIAGLRFLEKLIYRRSSRVIALSPGIRDGIVSTGTPVDRVAVIPNCSDLDLFGPAPPDPKLVSRYGLQGCCVVTHAGSMGEKNGLETLMDAAEILQRAGHHDIKVVLVGEGRSEATLRARIQSMGLRNVVLTGGVSRRDVAEILKASHVCLCLVKNIPVLSTCSPNKLFDALAAGRPVIVNIEGWMQELVESSGAGLFAKPDSGADLAARILEMARSPERRATMGQRARRLAESQFDRVTLAQRFENVLAAAVGQAVAPGAPPSPSASAPARPSAGPDPVALGVAACRQPPSE